MTGLPAHNYPAFNDAAAKLRALGWEVVNPAELTPSAGPTWTECMRRDIREMLTCGRLALLPGWNTSHGARIEAKLAFTLQLQVRPLDDYLSEVLP